MAPRSNRSPARVSRSRWRPVTAVAAGSVLVAVTVAASALAAITLGGMRIAGFGPDELASLLGSGGDGSTVAAVADPTTTTGRAPATASATVAVPAELAFDGTAGEASGATAPATTAVAPARSVPTSGAKGPATTVAAGPSAIDPDAVYKGLVARLGLDDPVATPVAAAPTVAPGVQPLTGLPGPVPDRPAAVVKIDNSPKARPQVGLEQADIVVEEEVEGGVTRLAAVFHSLGGVVGPVRSGRTTDIPVLDSLGSPLLVYSGANQVIDALLLRQPAVQNRSAERTSGYWRERARPAPSNLFTDLAAQWASGTGGPPPAQFAYRADGRAPTGGRPAAGFSMAYRANRVSWAWNGELWARSQGSAPHVVVAGGQLAVANVVVVETAKIDTGMVDTSGARVPEFAFVGAGPASVFTGGQRIAATWTRPTLRSAVTLTAADGSVVGLTPGRTWVEVVEAGVGQLR
ncbi:MAG: DUF3048 domain-containing protein [Acidimicrobiia bacterium]|nr:DUF3048 domain-containing protein [Acidimicrobiia bacterium]